MEPYRLIAQEVLKELASTENGLDENEAKIRLEKYGSNQLEKKGRMNGLKIFLNQFKSILVIILIAATGISFYLEEIIDGIIILIIVTLNAIFGFWQEYKAGKAIEALEKLSTPRAKVLRSNQIKEIPSTNLVPGDIVILEEGDKIPADCRLIETANLQMDESSLTGESLPIFKITDPLKECTLPDRKNCVYMGTSVLSGRGRALVIETGMKTEIGKIAGEVQSADEETPLQHKLEELGNRLGIIVIIIAAISASLAFIVLKTSLFESFKTGIALAVAAIPEGLPAVATLTLAIGVKKMSKNKAIIRRLSSVETLGSCSVICSDKTGTITQNKITAVKVLSDKMQDVDKINLSKQTENVLRCATLCNNSIKQDNFYYGDPTETAILSLADKYTDKKELLKYKRVKELSFSSERKRMSVVTKYAAAFAKLEIYSKGAIEVILDSCMYTIIDGKQIVMTHEEKKRILEINNQFTREALRVLAFSYRQVSERDLENDEKLEKDHVFLGLIGMIDPPREEVPEAIKMCRQAGIRVVMMTGDHSETAKAIGKMVGLDGEVLTGIELEKLSEKEIGEVVEKIDIYARVSPHHKMKILEALKNKGHIVAMTGDGVNDAPALKNADIGIAMGIKGTDVAKESSDMVLEDDNFATIVSAVREGRVIYDNIKNSIGYLLSANVGEVFVILLAILISSGAGLSYAIPLTAIQLLWLNLVTDGLPALALGTDPAGRDVLNRKPRDPKEKILSRKTEKSIILEGLFISVLTLASFYFNLHHGLIKAQTIAFTTLVVLELVWAQVIRMRNGLSVLSNKYFVLALLSSLLLQLIVLYTPLQIAFELQPLGLTDWEWVIGLSAILYIGAWGYYKIRKD